MKKILFTAIFGNYDSLEPIDQPGSQSPADWDCLCFTDNPDLKAPGWRIVYTEPQPKLYRKIKTCPHLFLPKHDLSIWVDGNIIPRIPLDEIVKKHYKDGYTVMTHPQRKCCFAEAKRCIELNKDNPETINAQMDRYRKAGYKRNMGMVGTGVLIRPAGVAAYDRFGEQWWAEIEKGSVRDQLSFNYVAWRHRLNYHTFPFLQDFDKYIHESKRVKV